MGRGKARISLFQSIRGQRERHKLCQRGPWQSPGPKRILVHFKNVSLCEVSNIGMCRPMSAELREGRAQVRPHSKYSRVCIQWLFS